MQFKQFLGAALAVVAVRAQEDNSTSSGNLTTVLAGNSDLTGLVSLLQSSPDIANALSGAQNITLLAPSNDALGALNSSGLLSSSSQQGLIQGLLNYHVLVGVFNSSQITETPAFPATLLNNTAFANVTGGQVVECRVVDDEVTVITGFKNNVTVTEADIAFDGGVIHIIDNLLTIPPNVSTIAQEAGLSAFLGAVNATNLTEAVNTTPNLTIFAPNNAAFQNISSALGNLTAEQAATILQYHVIAGTIAYSSTLANGSVPTLGGGNITITVDDDGAVFINRARVVVADVLIANGVLHILDSVLSTTDNSTANGTESSDTPYNAYPGASSGSDIPYTSNVPSATSSNAALTSTNAAVASGFPENTGGLGENSAGNPEASSTSTDAAPLHTGAMGAAALFGGAVILVNM